jgi:DNA polymerase elongation subunit (family B)
MHVTFKLLTFNCYDKKCISDNDSESKDGFKSDQEYLVQMFGINESGRTASIFVKGFKPFFYVKVPLSWKEQNKSMFISKLRDEMGDYYEDSIIGAKLIKRRKLYGFDGGVDHNFVMIEFESEISMKKAKKLWYTYQGGNQRLIPGGYDFGGDGLELYEGNIPPLLRLFHINNISPSGWVALPNKKTMRHKKYQKSTICDYEFTIQYKDIIPLPDKETLVPYKICSFDIEASSSHGDFPLPKKTYKKLAQNIINHWDDLSDDNKTDKYLRMIIDGAFQIKPYQMDGIDIVYPKRAISEDELEKLFLRWKTTKIEEIQKGEEEMNYFQQEDVEIEGEDEGFIEQDGTNESGGFKKFEPKQKYKKRGTIMNLLNDSESAKDLRIEKLKDLMDNIFPQLKGDEVTFIGSTFLHYGQEKPYLNHCAVKGECSDLPQVENSEIECFSSEKKLLVGWSKLIQKHNPDIIISYNGFGFDFEFMYVRAKELGCATKFMECSRNKGESCTSKKWNRETNQEETGLETNSIFLATGQYDIKYMKMNGRLLIDLYNCFRRDFQLIKYKLDYVASYFIGDKVSKLEHHDGKTKIFSKNLTGLEEESYVSFEEEAHSVDLYKEGQKFIVRNLNQEEGSFWIDGLEQPDMSKKVRWGLAKDDVTPQDIFRMTNEGPDQKAIIAKYCIQDCNLVHHLLRKVDFITGFVEMASLCSVPMEFLVLRGQGIKLTSYISKKCREKGILMPTIEKSMNDESYEGAIVLPPKCNLYLDEAVACVDYSSLYPSSMISENISHDSKVWTKEYDLDDNLVRETGDKDEEGEYIYDNMDGYEYVDIKYDTYKWRRKNNNPKAAMEKVCVGYKICRFAQFPEGSRAVMPSILEELLAARKATRKLIPLQKDAFMKNILDKRQLSIKTTANSLYGQTGAKTSTFYEVDCAASTTAIGRKLLTYARRVIEEAYKNVEVETKCHGKIKVDAEYVYGDTDSVFFKFNPMDGKGNKIKGQKALEVTIELAQEAGELATKFLKKPHDLEYEKTFWPFCLLSKKRYVGMLYEMDPHKCSRKSMGIVLKRRDNAPIVKDIYGGVIDILMKDRDIEKALAFLRECLRNMIEEKYDMVKLVITKSLRGEYKNPKTIAHKVLADRIGKRDPGNKPSVGDRVAFVYIENSDKKALQGERIETPEYIVESGLKINYAFYITNQIMKPLQQVFALVLEDMKDFKKKKGHTLRLWKKELDALKLKYPEQEQFRKKLETVRNKEVKALIFDEYLKEIEKKNSGMMSIESFFK